MSKVIGIDLGTTNSCIAVYENGEAKLSQMKGKIQPSIVAFTDKGEVLVGDPAKDKLLQIQKNNLFYQKNYGTYDG